ncbi:MAG: tRNA threonylcarbamoyladenosine dehydratase [Planctomycetia bacterium]|nr:tRNA threonylcarbamoyladenosine dehydratase [Planctomycetia bacterium]
MTEEIVNTHEKGTVAPSSASGGDQSQFQRTALLLGESGINRLHDACVLIAGMGAVGSYVVEALARAGVGRFRLVDFDVVQPSNINRQLFATWRTLGAYKVDVARERIADINPLAQVETRRTLINDGSVESLFEEDWAKDPDMIVDAIDSLSSKVALIATAKRRGLSLICSMGAALRTDANLIRYGVMTDATFCPLARQARKRLRRVGVDPATVPCVYSPEPVRRAVREGREIFLRAPIPEPTPEGKAPQGRPRNTLGSLPTITGLFGLRIAHETIMTLSQER